jgi:2-hydroxycyclohexanecarboxyl-CoA dehydrogenase
MKFKGKVALITGGSSGMGRAAALGFSREGAAVVVNDIDEKKLSFVADEINSAGGKITAVPGDITKHETIRRMVNKAVEDYGRIDVLFNYVGGDPDLAPQKAFIDQTEEYWDKMINLNLKSTILACRAVLDTMIKQKSGKIINTGAVAGKIGGPNIALYSAVKGGIIAFSKALALEFAQYNINVNCICPGPIETPGLKKVFSDQNLGQVTAIVPLKRLGLPEEVASAVLYLASDEAAFITGQALSVDGGATMI